MRAQQTKRGAWFAGLLVALSIAAASSMVASRTAAQDANGGTGRETEFVAMTGPAQESVPGGTLLVSAYAAVFVLLAAYVGRLALLQASTSRELARLDAALRAREGGGAGGSAGGGTEGGT
jgi:CcmD family protein